MGFTDKVTRGANAFLVGTGGFFNHLYNQGRNLVGIDSDQETGIKERRNREIVRDAFSSNKTLVNKYGEQGKNNIRIQGAKNVMGASVDGILSAIPVGAIISRGGKLFKVVLKGGKKVLVAVKTTNTATKGKSILNPIYTGIKDTKNRLGSYVNKGKEFLNKINKRTNVNYTKNQGAYKKAEEAMKARTTGQKIKDAAKLGMGKQSRDFRKADYARAVTKTELAKKFLKNNWGKLGVGGLITIGAVHNYVKGEDQTDLKENLKSQGIDPNKDKDLKVDSKGNIKDKKGNTIGNIYKKRINTGQGGNTNGGYNGGYNKGNTVVNTNGGYSQGLKSTIEQSDSDTKQPILNGEYGDTNVGYDKFSNSAIEYIDNADQYAEDVNKIEKDAGNKKYNLLWNRDIESYKDIEKNRRILNDLVSEYRTASKAEKQELKKQISDMKKIAAREANIATALTGSHGYKMSESERESMKQDILSKYARTINQAEINALQQNRNIDNDLRDLGLKNLFEQKDLDNIKTQLKKEEYAPLLVAIDEAKKGDLKAKEDIYNFFGEAIKKRSNEQLDMGIKSEKTKNMELDFKNGSQKKKLAMINSMMHSVPGYGSLGNVASKLILKYPNASLNEILNIIKKLADNANQKNILSNQVSAKRYEDMSPTEKAFYDNVLTRDQNVSLKSQPKKQIINSNKNNKVNTTIDKNTEQAKQILPASTFEKEGLTIKDNSVIGKEGLKELLKFNNNDNSKTIKYMKEHNIKYDKNSNNKIVTPTIRYIDKNELHRIWLEQGKNNAKVIKYLKDHNLKYKKSSVNSTYKKPITKITTSYKKPITYKKPATRITSSYKKHVNKVDKNTQIAKQILPASTFSKPKVRYIDAKELHRIWLEQGKNNAKVIKYLKDHNLKYKK